VVEGRKGTVRAFLVGFALGAMICVLSVGWLVHGLDSMPKRGSAAAGEDEYSVIVKIKLSDDGVGTQKEIAAGFSLEDDLNVYFNDHPEAGELDGDGYGFGYFDIYMYAANRDQLISEITPIVQASNPPDGSYIESHLTATGADDQQIDL
jgi:hypothetical protein